MSQNGSTKFFFRVSQILIFLDFVRFFRSACRGVRLWTCMGAGLMVRSRRANEATQRAVFFLTLRAFSPRHAISSGVVGRRCGEVVGGTVAVAQSKESS